MDGQREGRENGGKWKSGVEGERGQRDASASNLLRTHWSPCALPHLKLAANSCEWPANHLLYTGNPSWTRDWTRSTSRRLGDDDHRAKFGR